ncbi:M20/M25/M40 family metallo-hydrolase [Chitinophaga caseinilytica]|uniref:M20/M25/M40 family metallo-hydrolase n=1 Tax=Chitinophaga caseinilytica TaxID=2267521 RepID=A0ABZ2Z6N7_9BACT
MTRKLIAAAALLTISLGAVAQQTDVNEVRRIISTLAADDMMGRGTFTPGIEKASVFIEAEFEKAGLEKLPGATSYRQPFAMKGRSIYPADSLELVPGAKALHNVVGLIRGASKPNEFVIFSGHYDHIGILKSETQDTIANGADDDASGITAVILLARHFKQHPPERTVIFACFTAEEIGGFGSRYFSREVHPDSVVAMFNIEMIGKESKFGRNSAFITGFERSDFGQILQRNLEGSAFKFHPDPYPEQQLFYRSDNAMLAKLGVPAHTISTTQIDKDKLYHSVDDEVESLDLQNIADIIDAIAVSSGTIVSGKDTPTRVAKED